MSTWNKWKRNRYLKEDGNEPSNPVDNFKFNRNDNDYADDYQHLQQELFTTVYSKYPEECMQFLNGIAQRGDEEILMLLRKLQKDVPTGSPKGNEPRNPPEVVPPESDTGHGGGGEGDE